MTFTISMKQEAQGWGWIISQSEHGIVSLGFAPTRVEAASEAAARIRRLLTEGYL